MLTRDNGLFRVPIGLDHLALDLAYPDDTGNSDSQVTPAL